MDFWDIHIHLLPGVDDGPETMEESLRVIGLCREEGVGNLIITPHWDEAGPFGLALSMIDPGRTPAPRAEIEKIFGELKEKTLAQWPDMNLYLGAEFYFTARGLAALKSGEIPTLAGTRYVLTEFDVSAPWSVLREGIHQILLAGFLPVLAHTERYEFLEGREELVRELRKMGALIQVNTKNFLRNPKDPRAAWCLRLLEADLIQLVASDAHNDHWRSPLMAGAYNKLLTVGLAGRILGRTQARRKQLETIFFDNPARLAAGEYL